MSGIDVKQLDALSGPTPADQVKTRQGPGGRNLSYVDARYVMDRLDELGPENWQRDQRPIGDRVACGIGINIEGSGWVWKWDGAGDTDIEGDKGAFSDSFKRAAVNWGIARDLYGSSVRSGVASSSPAPVARRQESGIAPAAAAEPAWLDEEAHAAGFPPANEGRCPVHDKPWRTNSRGFYCATKVGDGWCREQPSKAWQARQEVA